VTVANIKKGDTVEVITGVHKGERGEVKRVDGKDGRVVVHNVNMVKKHQKPMQGGRASRTQVGIIEFEAPINLSNVLLVCPKCSEAVRVGFRVDSSEKVRVCKNCGEDIK
jgi:large subunit ribosomal protein L24